MRTLDRACGEAIVLGAIDKFLGAIDISLGVLEIFLGAIERFPGAIDTRVLGSERQLDGLRLDPN